jgi:hypothetical protein
MRSTTWRAAGARGERTVSLPLATLRCRAAQDWVPRQGWEEPRRPGRRLAKSPSMRASSRRPLGQGPRSPGPPGRDVEAGFGGAGWALPRSFFWGSTGGEACQRRVLGRRFPVPPVFEVLPDGLCQAVGRALFRGRARAEGQRSPTRRWASARGACVGLALLLSARGSPPGGPRLPGADRFPSCRTERSASSAMPRRGSRRRTSESASASPPRGDPKPGRRGTPAADARPVPSRPGEAARRAPPRCDGARRGRSPESQRGRGRRQRGGRGG